MTPLDISELKSHHGQAARIIGWIENVRDLKSIQFVVVRDSTDQVQVTNFKKSSPHITDLITTLTNHSVVAIEGQVNVSNDVKMGGVELLISGIDILSLAEPELPINEKTARDLRLDWRFLDLRDPKKRLIFEVQTIAEHAMRSFWVRNGFIEIHSPKLMGSPSESGAELFSLEYFGQMAFLAQSPQFYKQMAMAAGFDRVFEIGPVFRANPSFTSRHDTEFTSVDVEMSWVESHEDVMAFEERWMQHVLQEVKESLGEEISRLWGTEITVPELPFPRVTMEEAHRIIRTAGHTLPPENKGDLDPEGERIVAQHVANEQKHEFVFIKDYPIEVRPFYHMRYAERPELTKSFDLLWKGLEITTGAQREHRFDILKSQALEKGLSPEGIQYYLDFFRFGCPPHGGFGFGLTRMLMTLLGISNVREVTYLYRGPTRLTP